MEILNGFLELVNGLMENSILPDWLKNLLFFTASALLLALVFKDVLLPVWGASRRLYEKIMRRLFIKRNMYPYFTELTPREVYEAIQYYIPTRYSRRGLDPANEEEPVPENFTKEQEREGYPLLLNRFLETEFDSSQNNRFYFVLADCGMGKTTFLMNLFYYTLLRKKRHPCKYINMVNPGVIDAVKEIKKESGAKTAETILLLDALDENDVATKNYSEFMRELETETREFYCVVITSRTNFFEKAAEEHLPGVKRGKRITQDKIVKFYITPFTDYDIQKYLKSRYPWDKKKRDKAWAMMKNNKNLAARPMLLKFMDDLLNESFTFDYDFQLYQKLFDLWISRECYKTGQDKTELFQECLEIAKAIYRQWEKTGEIGISIDELKELNIPIPDIKLKGHALINRTSGGKFKFAHKSYWEYLLAYLNLNDLPFTMNANIYKFDRAEVFFLQMVECLDPYYAIIFFDMVEKYIITRHEVYFKIPPEMRNNTTIRNATKKASRIQGSYLITFNELCAKSPILHYLSEGQPAILPLTAVAGIARYHALMPAYDLIGDGWDKILYRSMQDDFQGYGLSQMNIAIYNYLNSYNVYASSDDAANCIAYLCRYYGKEVNITQLRRKMEFSPKRDTATSLFAMRKCADELGFVTKAVRVDRDGFLSDFTLPCVANVLRNGMSRFIIITRKTSEHISCIASNVAVECSVHSFFEEFTGVLLILKPGESFEEGR